MTATDTSTGITKQETPKLKRKWQKRLAEPPKHPSKKGNTRRCISSRRCFAFRPWLSVVGLLEGLRRRFPGVSLNRVLNEGFLLWLGGVGEDELRLRCRLARLLEEERELMQVNRVVLRSGAFLDGYMLKLLEGDEALSVKLGRLPLKAVADRREVNVVLRLAARREAVAREILEVEDKLLPKAEYVLKSDREGFREGVEGDKVEGGESG